MNRIRKALFNTKGVFDLPSVMVASIISVITFSALVVSVIALTRLSMDNGAKDRISNLTTAESSYQLRNNTFGTKDVLVAQLLGNDTAYYANACIVAPDASNVYRVVSRSTTGNIFYALSTDPTNIIQETANNKYCLP